MISVPSLHCCLERSPENLLDRLSITEDTIRTHSPSQNIQLLFRISKEFHMWIKCQAERWKVRFDPKFLCMFSVCYGYKVKRLMTKTFRTSKLITTPQINSKIIKNSSCFKDFRLKPTFLSKKIASIWMKQSGNNNTALQHFMQICMCSLQHRINTILEKHAIKSLRLKARMMKNRGN